MTRDPSSQFQIEIGDAVPPPDLPPLFIAPSFVLDPDWAVIEDGFLPSREADVESRMTLANGFLGVRGSLPERVSRSSPATFIAGVFEPTRSGDTLEPLILPDWTHVRIEVEGEPLSLEKGDLLTHVRMLDLRHGWWRRVWRQRDAAGRVTRVECLRLASLHDRHGLLQVLTIAPENYAGRLTVVAPYDERGEGRRWQRRRDVNEVVYETITRRGVAVATARDTRVSTGRGEGSARAVQVRSDGRGDRWSWNAGPGEVAQVLRRVVVTSSRECPDPLAEARGRVRAVQQVDLEAYLARHARAWTERWQTMGVTLIGDASAQRALRFAAFHLAAAVNPGDTQVSIGARGLTGPVYKGHVFWDTEIYLLPFYSFTHPQAARALLTYRYHTLSAARQRARTLGYAGALFAWESADTGDDVTPDVVTGPDGRPVRVLTGEQEHHISADIAYAVWQYWQATGDDLFMRSAGAELLIETARFWASRGRVEEDGRYHIRTVIGPDEYHEGVDDNAYTNVMAQWTLERAVETVEWLLAGYPEDWAVLANRINLVPAEPATWTGIAERMSIRFDSETQRFEQFAGFFRLEDLDLAPYRGGPQPIDAALGQERIGGAQVVKQADVVALSALLWERFPAAVHAANFRYYEPRTAHGSSLSPAFHALVSARLGDVTMATRYFNEAAAIDLGSRTGQEAGGVHMATLGGLWQAAVFGLAGVRLRADGLVLDPHLPPTWDVWTFALQWRGRRLGITIDRDPGRIVVDVCSGDPLMIEAGSGVVLRMEPGRRYVSVWRDSGWGPWHDEGASTT